MKQEDANRMKFSTLTKGDLVKAYKNKQNHLEWGQAKAGVTRHTLDWFYGINLSRAFTKSIKEGVGQFKVLSTGRVQAPALHFLAEREKKIAAFNPENFSEIYLDGLCKSVEIRAQYELPDSIVKERKKQVEDELDEEDQETKVTVDKLKIFDDDWANKVKDETTGKDGSIKDITAKQFKQKVPIPFDLTSLQMEASNMLGLSPKRTLEIAQNLYTHGYTSYPRTSSQKLPKELELKDKLQKLAKQPIYKDKVDIVFKVNPELKPNEGKKEDPAHPSIHPTGEIPSKLEGQEQRLYDLIVKRFLAIFGKDALRETNTIEIDINSHKFILKGTRTLEKNWHELYEPYLRFEEIQLPKLDKGDDVENKNIEKLDKETSPPKRYTDASIIKALEKRNLGTKATRAAILDQLRERGYIEGKSIKVSELGIKLDEVISEDVPDLVDENLTRQFEAEMEDIREEKSTPEKVLAIAQKELTKILAGIKSNEIELGKKLAQASKLSNFLRAKIAPCPNCDEGTLILRRAKKTGKHFVGCNKYPDCKTIFNVPNLPVIKGLEDEAIDEEGKIWVLAGKSEGNLRKLCINDKVEVEESGEKKYEQEGMTCPTCNEGTMKLRKSYYGEFLGCDNYPKCKTMMKIENGVVQVDTPIVTADKPKKKATPKKKTTTKKTTKKDSKKEDN
jgi:DNA topoisomerase-1